SRERNLHSESSARFEKGIDYISQEIGLKRALALFDKYGWGKIVAGCVDCRKEEIKDTVFTYDYNKVNSVIGIDVDKEKIISILNNLELTTVADGDVLTTVIPNFREDIVGVNDIAEEVVRFYGYDELKPRLISTKRGGKSPEQERMEKLKNIMVGYGCQETVTYSFISPKAFDALRLDEKDELRRAIEISNPLGADFSIMRTTLSYSMLKLIASNFTRGNKCCRLFEIANVYLPKSLPLTELPEEKQTLAIGCFGEGETFYKIKAIIEDVAAIFGLEFKFSRGELNYLHPGRTAFVFANGRKIGYIGEIHPLVKANFGLDKPVYIAELDADFIAVNGRGIKPYKAISKYQAVERDLALIAPIDFEAGDILSTIRSVGGNMLENLEIFDVYVGGQVPKGKKSVAVKLTLRLLDKTLTDGEVNEEIDLILKTLEKKNVVLR
ncbi:MAG: phenylalanine--tRNA ligase subunit beta, partial [Christensenellales bacterium]